MKKTVLQIGAAALSLFFLFGCHSVPETIPGDLSSQQLIQLGQASFENGNIAAAELYYLTLIDRYGSDPALRVEALFEIAHMDVKKKKWNRAVPILREIERMYASEMAAVLPGAYRRLVEIDLAKIPQSVLDSIPEDASFELKPGAPVPAENSEASELVNIEESLETEQAEIPVLPETAVSPDLPETQDVVSEEPEPVPVEAEEALPDAE